MIHDMKYDTSVLRRQDRALPREEACELLQNSEYGILCMQELGGGGYGIPLNYVWDGGECLYMHCAPLGHKLDCLAHSSRVTFVITGANRILPEKFSTAYASLLVHGEAQVVTDEEEKIQALRLLIQKLTPQEAHRGEQYIARAVQATGVIRLRITGSCGKAHRA